MGDKIVLSAIACDYDRTLTDEKLGLNREAQEALASIRDKVKLILVTGRTIPNLPTSIFNVFHVIVAENGALILDIEHGQKYVTKPKDWDRIRSSLIEEVYDPTVELGEVVASFSSQHYSRLRESLERKGFVKDAFLELNRDRVMLLPIGVDKAYGLKKAAEILGVKLSALACIGDGENDIALFKVAGFKVAVANAVDELKKMADYVCCFPNGLGVIDFLKKFILY